MICHMVMNIDTALDMALMRGRFTCETDENGIGLVETGYFNQIRQILGFPEGTHQTVIVNGLNDMKKEGFEVIPAEGCAHLPNGKCPGHKYRGVAASKVHV